MQHTFRENLVRVVAVLGLIAVLLLGAWGIIQLAFFIPSLFSGAGAAFTKTTESLTVQAPATVAEEHVFPITWTHKGGSGAYSFALSYSCADGLSVLAPLPNGSLQPVVCDTPFNYVQASSSMNVVATLSGTKTVSTTIKVTSTQLSSGSISKTATAKMNITPAAATSTTPATTTKKPATTTTTTKKPTATKTSSQGARVYQASGNTTNLYGSPDLIVRITYAAPNYSSGRTAVEFTVENIGTNVAAYGWGFDATIPWGGGYPYSSGAQRALYPGDRIVYTLGYENDNAQETPVYPGACLSYSTQGCIGSGVGYGYTSNPGYQSYTSNGGHTVFITVDPYNQVRESNENNNTASATY